MGTPHSLATAANPFRSFHKTLGTIKAIRTLILGSESRAPYEAKQIWLFFVRKNLLVVISEARFEASAGRDRADPSLIQPLDQLILFRDEVEYLHRGNLGC